MMRGHIALHIILGDTQGDVCGFCGRVGSSCDPTLKQSSHRAGKLFYTPWAECSYRHVYNGVPTMLQKHTNEQINLCFVLQTIASLPFGSITEFIIMKSSIPISQSHLSLLCPMRRRKQ